LLIWFIFPFYVNPTNIFGLIILTKGYCEHVEILEANADLPQPFEPYNKIENN